MNDYFRLQEKGTTVTKELIAGLTTFLSMAYILGVNPGILSTPGTEMNFNGVFIATVVAAALGTLIMGILANYPVALAPGMGMNAFFTYTVIFTMGYKFEQALAGIFISGIIFLILALTGVREKIINAIPNNLKLAVGAGIGFFIAFIGLKNSGIITYLPNDNPAEIIPTLGDLGNPAILVAVIGLIITIILYVLKVPAAIFLGLVITTIVSVLFGQSQSGAAQAINFKEDHLFGAFFKGFTDGTWDFKFFIVIFTFLFLDFFDTAGTLVTVGRRAGLVSKEGQLLGSKKALVADATATVIGAVSGTSSTTSYVESLSGVEAGGRTGLTSVFTGLFFVLSIVLLPLTGYITAAVTAPALIMVGILMASQLKEIDWDDTAVAVPAFLTIIAMPLAYSISTGIALGFIFYPITLLVSKRHKEINVIMYILAVVFILYFLVSSNTVMDPIYDLFK
ncbi:NCS2 family permease [Mycoplasmatota bacterium]|nr:NCS2 family permease [Mycoplasmatota bacterium]